MDTGGHQVLSIVSAIARRRGIPQASSFAAIERSLKCAVREQFPDAASLDISIDPDSGEVVALVEGRKLDPEGLCNSTVFPAAREVSSTLAEAEQQASILKFRQQNGEIVFGESVYQGGDVVVGLGRSVGRIKADQLIPGETVSGSVVAAIAGVHSRGGHAEVELSRTTDSLLRSLLAHHVPEIQDGRVRIEALARCAGYRSKVGLRSAVVNPVDACRGENGERIQAVCDDLAGEAVDLLNWTRNPVENICTALRPATVGKVISFPLIGRALVLVAESELRKAEGRRGQNLLLASKLCGVDIWAKTEAQWAADCTGAREDFKAIGAPIACNLPANGFFTYGDLSVIEPDDLMRLCRVGEAEAERLIECAEELAGY